jgi:hypothetical protein
MRTRFFKPFTFFLILTMNLAYAQVISSKQEAELGPDESPPVLEPRKPVTAVSNLKPVEIKIVTPEIKAAPMPGTKPAELKPISSLKPAGIKIVAPVIKATPMPGTKAPEITTVEPEEEDVVVPYLDEDEDVKPDKPESIIQVDPAVIKKEIKEEIKKSEEVVAESTRNYKPETCVWAEDIPRKIVMGKSCSAEGSRICVGYVVCEQKVGGGKFTRMSTCSEGLCGDADAAACTREGGYGSFKPKPKNAEFVSKKIQDVLKSSAKGE